LTITIKDRKFKDSVVKKSSKASSVDIRSQLQSAIEFVREAIAKAKAEGKYKGRKSIALNL